MHFAQISEAGTLRASTPVIGVGGAKQRGMQEDVRFTFAVKQQGDLWQCPLTISFRIENCPTLVYGGKVCGLMLRGRKTNWFKSDLSSVTALLFSLLLPSKEEMFEMHLGSPIFNVPFARILIPASLS